jgi:hypothetical protein
MDVVADLSCVTTPGAMRAVIGDLATYASWLEIVRSADPAPAEGGDPGPAWSVVLQGRIGPLRRTKRLRMVRSVDDELSVRFERRELDDRSHSPWVLDASIEPADVEADQTDMVTLRMALHYGGSLWVPVLDRLLADEIARSRTRLVALLAR